MKVFGQWRTWPQAQAGLAGRLPEPVLAKLGAAYRFAAAFHQGQTRPAGEPYTEHLLEVLEILAAQAGDTDPVLLTAGLLHDVVEDTAGTPSHIRERFGTPTAWLVVQVTVPPLPTGQDRTEHRTRFLTRLADAPAPVRRLKLADRYSNVQRLDTHPRPVKQRAYYQETCRHFLPLAAADPAFTDLFTSWRDAYAYLAPPANHGEADA